MPPSKLDALYRSLLLTKFFCKGWGKPENLQRLFEFRKIISNREACYRLVPRDYPVEITKEEVTSDSRILEGKFVTPLELYLPGLVPKVAQDAHFQIILPLKWKEEDYKPVCLHLAGTGDHYFWRRRNLIAKPLLKEGLGAILLENPFYGLRKPKDQKASSLHNVSDIFVMGGCLVLESLVLFHWCERNGLGPLGITGLSMGGHMASLAATNWPKPLVLVPCLSWSTASSVFTQGVMSQSINWDVLETQYFADGNYRERLSKMVTIVDDAFLAGQHFVQNFSASMQELKKDLKDVDEFIKTLPEENVNLTVVPQVPASIQPPQQKIVVLNGQSNKLNLSPTLLQKLLCTDKVELTTDEINELNTKIRIALNELKAENDSDEAAANEKKQLQSDTAAGDKTTIITSVYEFGKTKLIALISPSSNTNEAKIVATTDTAAVAKLDKDKVFDVNRTKWWEREASQFMRGIMDECTHLKNFSVPYDTSLIIAVCAKDDAYIPRDGCSSLEDIWPGAEIRYLDAGHVSAFVLHQKIFRSSILEGFERAKKIYRENPQYRSQATVTSQTAPPVQA